MQRTATQPTTKQGKSLNRIGIAYRDAKKPKQLLYQAALIEASENDECDYWRSFRDVWQYSPRLGKAPFLIVALADEILNAKNLNPVTK